LIPVLSLSVITCMTRLLMLERTSQRHANILSSRVNQWGRGTKRQITDMAFQRQECPPQNRTRVTARDGAAAATCTANGSCSYGHRANASQDRCPCPLCDNGLDGIHMAQMSISGRRRLVVVTVGEASHRKQVPGAHMIARSSFIKEVKRSPN